LKSLIDHNKDTFEKYRFLAIIIFSDILFWRVTFLLIEEQRVNLTFGLKIDFKIQAALVKSGLFICNFAYM